MDEPTAEFRWNAEECLKLLDRGYRIVLFKDGLGTITAIAVPRGKGLNAQIREWSECDLADEGTAVDPVFGGVNKFSGGGVSVGQALHCLTEKAVFDRLPDGKGGYHLRSAPRAPDTDIEPQTGGG